MGRITTVTCDWCRKRLNSDWVGCPQRIDVRIDDPTSGSWHIKIQGDICRDCWGQLDKAVAHGAFEKPEVRDAT